MDNIPDQSLCQLRYIFSGLQNVENIFLENYNHTFEIYIWVTGGYELFIYILVNIKIIIFFKNFYFS